MLTAEHIVEKNIDVHPHFGGCPECGQLELIRHVGKVHFGCCDEHRTCWLLGSNLLDGWRHQTEEQSQENDRLLRTYKCTEPVHDPRDVIHEIVLRWASEAGSYTCPICGIEFPRNTGLSLALGWETSLGDDKPGRPVCMDCGKRCDGKLWRLLHAAIGIMDKLDELQADCAGIPS